MNTDNAKATPAVILLIFFLPSSPSSRSLSSGGRAYVNSCIIIDALIYGVIESENNVACESAPPVIVFRYSRKLPFVAFYCIQLLTTAVSRNGTATALPNLKITIMSNVYKSFFLISGTLQARFSV